jgi:lipoyl-dependent peroxiredoxin
MAIRTAKAQWDGSLKEGSGHMRLGGGAYEGPYSFQSRFEEGDGTNPEELIAAAHAGCFSMALSGELGRAGHEPTRISTTARVNLVKRDEGFTITRIELETEGEVPGIDQAEFEEKAQAAKTGCPVSRALGGVSEITVKATLV